MDYLRSTCNHHSKYCFPNSEIRHATIMCSMLPYYSSNKEYLINDIRSNTPNIHININIPNIDFAFNVQRSTNFIGSYIVMNPIEENWTDMTILAPTILPNVEAYGKFVRIMNHLKVDYSLDMHLMPINGKNSDHDTHYTIY